MAGSIQKLEEVEVQSISREYGELRRLSWQIRKRNWGLFGLKVLMRIPFTYRKDGKFYQRYLAPPERDMRRIDKIRTRLVDLYSHPVFKGREKDDLRVKSLQDKIINFRIGLDMYKAEVQPIRRQCLKMGNI